MTSPGHPSCMPHSRVAGGDHLDETSRPWSGLLTIDKGDKAFSFFSARLDQNLVGNAFTIVEQNIWPAHPSCSFPLSPPSIESTTCQRTCPRSPPSNREAPVM